LPTIPSRKSRSWWRRWSTSRDRSFSGSKSTKDWGAYKGLGAITPKNTCCY
jgi:hypothetical protein